MRRFLLFLNPLRVKRSRASSVAMERCVAMLRGGGGVFARGCTVETRETLAGDAAGEQARHAVAEGFHAIFACGGDGTVFHLLQGLAGTDAVLGVIPLGTGNVLAHNLGLPRDPVAALHVQLKVIDATPVPLGEVAWGERRWLFTFAAGVGMHAALMGLDPNGPLKRRLGRAAYFADGAKLLLTRPVEPFEAGITNVDGTDERIRASELVCARVEWINRWHAGGDLLSPHLRMAFVPPTNRLGLTHAFVRALAGRGSHRDSGGYAPQRRAWLPLPCYRSAASVICRNTVGDPASLPVEADGEFLGTVARTETVRFGVARERIRLLMPDTRRR